MAMAEELRPIISLATWKDRASVARNTGKDTPLRELRSIVASASTVTLDDGGRRDAGLAADQPDRARHRAARALGGADHDVPRRRPGARCRPGLDPSRPSRRPASRPSWPSAWPTPPGRPWPPDTAPADWLALLEVVVECPVRRNVKPAGLPDRSRRGPAGRGPQGRRSGARAGQACSGSRSPRRPAPVVRSRPARPVRPAGAPPDAHAGAVRRPHRRVARSGHGAEGGSAPVGRCITRSRALKPADSKKFLAARSPGWAVPSTPVQPWSRNQSIARSTSRWPRPTSRAPGLDEAEVEDAAPRRAAGHRPGRGPHRPPSRPGCPPARSGPVSDR